MTTEYFSLLQAAKSGDLEGVKFYLEKNTDFCYKNDLLLYGVEAGQINIVKYAIKHGADVRIIDNSPIFTAIDKGYFKIVKFLFNYYSEKEKDEIMSYVIHSNTLRNTLPEITKYLFECIYYED